MDVAWPYIIVSITVLIVYTLDRLEHQSIKSIFDWFPSILLSYVIPASLSAILDIDLSSNRIHDLSRSWLIPLAIISVMSSLSIKQIKNVGYQPIVIFVFGSMWIALFPILYCLLWPGSTITSDLLITDEYWKGMPPIVGSWIGGSTSQLVLKELVNCPEEIFLAILVMDNILVNIWTLIMFQMIKNSDRLNNLLSIKDEKMPDSFEQTGNEVWSASIIIIMVITINLIIQQFVPEFIYQVILLSLIGLFLSNAIAKWNQEFSLKIGAILILIVMAVLGLKLRFELLEFNPTLILFMIVWLTGHLLFMMLGAKLLNVNLGWVAIGSMANVGGIATAPAVTAAYRKEWMPHAVLLAILSMATGTFWGMLTIFLFQNLIIQ